MSTPDLFHCPNCNAGLDLEENSADVARRTAKRESQESAVRRPRQESPQPYRFMGLSIFLIILFVILILAALILIFAF